ncbi:FHIPEP family type III secretion protein [Salinarimonas ramus]|uniref:Flagellar biosynthesis protein FlhA n=1 Tax=Salinarimonas ramus TaxID=690164 RepID=A0A917V6S9_9HYPH|nr:FHIPEP family type III secretion protein [Salinarimonas ramus]GGK45436.1 hypothetical protein GCM10011322_35810 [Salinarimonas ramus]
MIEALVLGPDVETAMRKIASSDATALRTAEATVKKVVDLVRKRMEENAREGVPLCLMTPADLRRQLRRVLKQHKVELPVLSFADVAPDYQMRTVAVVGTAKAAA